MKKNTEERILDYVIRINTELIKTNARIGDLEDRMSGFEERFEKIEGRLDKIEEIISEMNAKLDWVGEKVFIDHENQLGAIFKRIA